MSCYTFTLHRNLHARATKQPWTSHRAKVEGKPTYWKLGNHWVQVTVCLKEEIFYWFETLVNSKDFILFC